MNSPLSGFLAQLYVLPGCSNGGPLHIVVDDYNCADEHLKFCEQELLGIPEVHWSVKEAWEQGRGIDVLRVSIAILDYLRPYSERDREELLRAS